jgi:BlaI family transcriptional regulator, penicillinase repressor
MSLKKHAAELSELSRREAQIMEVLYATGPTTVADLTEKMPADLSRNAIRTFLTILTSKGVVTRTKQGREFIYTPSSEKAAAARSAFGRLLDVFFNGSVSDAVAARFSGSKEQIGEDELVRLEMLIADARRKKSKL